MKRLFFSLFLLVGFATFSFAQGQGKTELTTITYNSFSRVLFVSNGLTVTKTTIDKEDVEGNGDLSPGIREANKMLAKDWELVNSNAFTDNGSYVVVFVLKGKKP